MFTVFRAILIVLTYLKYAMMGGFTRTVLSLAALKVFMAFFFGVVFPIIFAFVMLKVQGYVFGYVLDYVNANISLEAFPVAMQMTGIAAYLFTALGLDVAFNIVLTASLIRFSMSFFRAR